MRNNDQILAEVFDSLIKQDGGQIPSEVGELFNLGLRLHNECPNVNPGFLAQLGRRLESEWAGLERPRVAAHGAPGAFAIGRLLRPAHVLRPLAIVAIAIGLVLLSALSLPALRSSVEASLSRVITVFRQVEVERQPRLDTTPVPTPETQRWYASVEDAQEAAGFTVYAPSYLPAGLRLRGVDVAEIQGRRMVALRYIGKGENALARDRDGLDTLVIQEFLTTQTPEQVALAMQVGPGSVERLEVAGRPALWIKGDWNAKGRWIRGGQEGMLLLQDAEVFVQVWGSFGREESIRIAGSLFE